MFKKMLGLFKEQKKQQNSSHQNKKHLVSSSTSSQAWLDQNYPKKIRDQINSLEISGKSLGGLLNLVDFTNLEELYCYDNQLTGIKFATNSFDKLRVLHVGGNSFCEQDLDLFSHLSGLEVLNLRNNNFQGDLRVLKDLVNFRSLDISDTNISSGLIYLSEKLESLFCQIEKESECQKIKEALKDYDLGNDCYDFQNWWKDENWLVIPGSWPKDKVDKDTESSVREEVFKERFFGLVNNIYQALIESEEKTPDLLFIEKDIDEFWKIAKKEKEIFDDLKEQFEFEPRNLILVAEKYVSDNKKIKILEKRIRELEQNNNLLAEKNEFWRLLQLELTKQNSEEQEIMDEPKEFEIVKFNKKTHKYKNKKNTNNIMTNNINTYNNKKIYILEWESTELKDGTSGTKLRYEKFGVIAGGEKEELKFYSTFFTGSNKFKKGEIYELSTPGNFVQDLAEIIQGVNSGGYEFEKVAPSLAIKELWEEKESNIEKLNALEEDLQGKKNNISRISEELISKKREFDDLQSRFNNLQTEKNKLREEKEKISEELNLTKTSLQKKEEQLVSSKGEATQLQNQVTDFKTEKIKMENEWLSPTEKAKFIQEKEDLSNQAKKEKEVLSEQFKKERRSKQLLIETLEDLRGQKLKETIEEKLAEKKRELEKLETAIVEKLGGNQKSLLENFLEKQEDFDTALFDDVSQTSRSFLRAKEKLQDARVKLVAKVSAEEVEELCKIQSEIGKLEASQKQWEKMEEQQRKEEQEQYESYTETPPTPPRNN